MGITETYLKDYIIKFKELSDQILMAHANQSMPEQTKKLVIKQLTSKLEFIADYVKKDIDTRITKVTYSINGDENTYYRLLPVSKEVADLLIPILERSLNLVVIETKEIEVTGLENTIIYPK